MSAGKPLSDLLTLAAAQAGDPDAVAVWITFEGVDGEVRALRHCPQGLRRLCRETIMLATQEAHDAGAGLH